MLKNRIISIPLALAMLVSAIPANIYAQDFEDASVPQSENAVMEFESSSSSLPADFPTLERYKALGLPENVDQLNAMIAQLEKDPSAYANKPGLTDFINALKKYLGEIFGDGLTREEAKELKKLSKMLFDSGIVEQLFKLRMITCGSLKPAEAYEAVKDILDPDQINCPLTLDTLVDGQKKTTLEYDSSHAGDYDVQVGGILQMENVWNRLNNFKKVYINGLKTSRLLGNISILDAHQASEWNGKQIAGFFTFRFKVNPQYVNTLKDTNKDDWTNAFVAASIAALDPDASDYNAKVAEIESFFSFMKPVKETYSNDGTCEVLFMMGSPKKDANGNYVKDDYDSYQFESGIPASQIETGMVNTIAGNSPENVLKISQNTMKGIPYNAIVTAVNGDDTSFSGEISLLTWLTYSELFFPVEFVSNDLNHAGLDLVGKNQTGGSTGGNGSGTTAPANTVALYRLYNPNSGEHFYTQALVEKDYLANIGWDYEGIGWYSPTSSNIPVYRLYNPNAGDHHYTKNKEEKDELSKIGWKYEGIGFYSLPDNQGVKVYREYNPNAKMAGAHNYTTNKVENDYLISIGWLDEGIGWWASAAGKPAK